MSFLFLYAGWFVWWQAILCIINSKKKISKNGYFFYIDNYQNANMHIKQPIWRNETKSLETCLLLFSDRVMHQISKKQRNHPIGDYKTTLLKRVFRVYFFLGSYELKCQNTCKHPVRYQTPKAAYMRKRKDMRKKTCIMIFFFF